MQNARQTRRASKGFIGDIDSLGNSPVDAAAATYQNDPGFACFRLRCEARAYLFAIGDLDLHEAVDRLQADAERDGLVWAIGQDAVQGMIGAAFGAVR